MQLFYASSSLDGKASDRPEPCSLYQAMGADATQAPHLYCFSQAPDSLPQPFLEEYPAVDVADTHHPDKRALLDDGNSPEVLKPMYEAASRTGSCGATVKEFRLMVSSTFLPSASRYDSSISTKSRLCTLS